jgi:hypothetical protein
MDYSRLRNDFLQFHYANPWVYEKLEECCERLWEAGWRKYSMRTLVALIRFDADLQTSGSELNIDGEAVSVKICNNHAPYYARLLAYKRPKFERFFNYRHVHGETRGVAELFSDIPGEESRLLYW